MSQSSALFFPPVFTSSTMRGFSQINGLIPCENFHVPDLDQPQSIVADGDVVLQFELDEEVLCVPALMWHFLDHGNVDALQLGLYFVSGKVGMVTEGMDIGMGSLDGYTLLIEANVVRSLSPLHLRPLITKYVYSCTICLMLSMMWWQPRLSFQVWYVVPPLLAFDSLIRGQFEKKISHCEFLLKPRQYVGG